MYSQVARGTFPLRLSQVGSRTGAVQIKPVSNPLHVKRSMRISRTTLPC